MDAVVVGAGPNGLVAANLLADAGWSVALLEAQPQPGGAVRTEQVTAPGFHNDLFSAFYPFTAASPVIARLDLARYGLRWTHAGHVLAHPRPDGPAAVLDRDVEVTAASSMRRWRRRPPTGVCTGTGARSRIHCSARCWARSPRPLVGPAVAHPQGGRHPRPRPSRARCHFDGSSRRSSLGRGAGLLFAGLALHADLTPDAAGSALFGWLLAGLGQQYGFPVPVGGAGRLTDALVARAVAGGVVIRCDTRVDRVVVSGGRATGVVTEHGDLVQARHAVLADCDARHLLLSMVGVEHLHLGSCVDWIASSAARPRSSSTGPCVRRSHGWTRPPGAPGPCTSPRAWTSCRVTATQLATGLIPAEPFLLVGQMTTSDPTRSPPGTESAWAYTHVRDDVAGDAGDGGISGTWDDDDARRFADRMEHRIESLAPGFTDLIISRHVMAPPDLESRDANLVGGDISGGTAQLHQQLVFRPIAGSARAETPVRRLFLASASAHPGGAVHGACGANAARAAIWHRRIRR